MQIEEKEYDQSFDWRIWKNLFPFMKPFRKYMIIALVFNTLCALVDIALPLFQQYAINHFISGNTTEGIGSFAGTYLVTIIFIYFYKITNYFIKIFNFFHIYLFYTQSNFIIFYILINFYYLHFYISQHIFYKFLIILYVYLHLLQFLYL